MATTALETSAAHPLYLYVVFVVCVVAAVGLLIGASVSRRNSSWRRQVQSQPASLRHAEPAYPVEPARTAGVTDTSEGAAAELVTVAAKKTSPRKPTATTSKKTAAAKKSAAKKTPAKRSSASGQ